MKKLKLIAKVIAIIIICLIGFVGIYLPWQKPLQMNNLVKESINSWRTYQYDIYQQ